MSADMAMGEARDPARVSTLSWRMSVLSVRFWFVFVVLLLLFFPFMFLGGHALPEAGGNAIKITHFSKQFLEFSRATFVWTINIKFICAWLPACNYPPEGSAFK